MIADKAVEAAARVIALELGSPSSWAAYRHLAREALEVAEPYMLGVDEKPAPPTVVSIPRSAVSNLYRIRKPPF